MQSVPDRWYIVYSRVAAIIATLFALACLACWFVPTLKQYATPWGLIYVTFGLVIIKLLYLGLLYKRESERSSLWTATLLLYLLQTISIFALIHSSGQLESIYLLALGGLVLVSGMFGLYIVVGISFITTLYFVLVAIDGTGEIVTSPVGFAALFGSYLASILSYIIFRKFYINRESTQIAKLSGALKSKQLQSEILIQSIADGIIVTNTDGKITLMNPAAAIMTEWAVDEATGIDVQLVVKLNEENGEPTQPGTHPFSFVITQKQATTNNWELEGRNGKKQIVSCVISPVLLPKSEEIAGTVAVLRDISNAHAEEARRADFISTASHEMRTPVAAIEGYLALALNDRVSKIDAKARDYLEKAHSSTQHLGQLFQDLLTSAKAEDGRLVSHPTVIEMGSYLEQVSDALRFSAEKKGLLVEFVIGTANVGNSASAGNKIIKPLYYVHADADRLREVITNLFDNAVKYTDKGKLSLGLTGNNEVVQFYIRDTGNGIPDEDIPHLFQKFYRVDNSSTRTVGGTGLGLFICRKIIELYKGRIWVESQQGKGTTFYINLPRISSQKARELQIAEAAESPLGRTANI